MKSFQPFIFFSRENLDNVKYAEGSEMEGKDNPGHIQNKQKTQPINQNKQTDKTKTKQTQKCMIKNMLTQCFF